MGQKDMVRCNFLGQSTSILLSDMMCGIINISQYSVLNLNAFFLGVQGRLMTDLIQVHISVLFGWVGGRCPIFKRKRNESVHMFKTGSPWSERNGHPRRRGNGSLSAHAA